MILKKILRIILKTIVIFLGILVVAVISLSRADLPLTEAEETYFTADSFRFTAEIDDTEGNPVTIDLHYIDSGLVSDPVVVLLHGAFSSSHTFAEWTELLLTAGYRVLAIDLPNHGLTGNFSDHTISQRRSAALVKALLDELGITSCFIGGNSMGGGVCWEFASEYHGVDGFAVLGLVLIDAVYPGMENGAPAGMASLSSHPLVAGILSKLTPRFLLKNILSGVYGSASILKEETIDRYYDLLRVEGHREALLLAIQEPISSTDPTGQERLETIRDAGIPTLVMWGEEDTWIPVAYAQAFQTALNLPDSDILLYPGRGHVPMEEDPAGTGSDLIAFLDAHRD